MSVFKCKMCGGTIEFEQGDTVGICDSCGTKQTLPRIDNDKKANLYDRANHFRRNNDFDKAMGIYEQILNEDNTDAESYWSLVLCRYGIEYVEDPTSHKHIPTVNRMQYTSIFNDEDYKAAIRNADIYQKSIYEQEAKSINEIQKGILSVSQKEEPFDVFICYKETDNAGRRTQDSVLATELYRELTRDGYKVFFSRITLEDKLGTAYEPYIFAALNSAKVMVVIGTKPEFFNAVWVRNEWSRYLTLIKNGEKKILIPAYRDMDPYDLPAEFSHLQALDMSKLGFMQDLTYTIDKIIKRTQEKERKNQNYTSVKDSETSHNNYELSHSTNKNKKIIISIVAVIVTLAAVAVSVILFNGHDTKTDGISETGSEKQTTVNMSTDLMEEITVAYLEKLTTVYEYGDLSEYSIYDIDGNGIPELIYIEGVSMSERYYSIYTYNDGPQILHTDGLGHSDFAVPLNGNGLYILFGHMGSYSVCQMNYSEDVGITEKICKEGTINDVSKYAEVFSEFSRNYLYMFDGFSESVVRGLINLGYDEYLNASNITPNPVS